MNEAIDILRWILGSVAIGLGGVISLGNWVTVAGIILTKKSSSFVPLVGGMLVTVGMVLLPVEGLWKIAWIGLFTDFGTIPLWTWVGIAELMGKTDQAKKNKKPNKAEMATPRKPSD